MLRLIRCLRMVRSSSGVAAEIGSTSPCTAVGALHAPTPLAWSTGPQILALPTVISQLRLSSLTFAACGIRPVASTISHLLGHSNSGSSSNGRIHTSSRSTAPSQEDAPVSHANPLSPPTSGSNPLSSASPLPGVKPVREAVAHLRYIRISPKKLNDFVRVIRKLHVNEAVLQSSISIKKAAGLVHKCIMSARANAINNFKLDPDLLYIDTAIVGSGAHQKRIDVKARGKRGLRKKYRAHMTIKVRELHGDEMEGRPRFTKVHLPFLQRGKDKRGTRPSATEEPFVPYFP